MATVHGPGPGPGPARRSLSALLSKLLVAFTIEFDNEFENRMPHWTSLGGQDGAPSGAPWLTSQVMWANVMQYIGDEGVSIPELHARARTTKDSLVGLQRWGYVVVDPADEHVRTTASGRQAQGVWRPLGLEIEGRWRERFGRELVGALRGSLDEVRDRFGLDGALPRYLPVIYPTQNGKAEIPPSGEGWAGAGAGAQDLDVDLDLDLSTLLSQVLLQFTLDYESQARLSLAISATTLRVLDEVGVLVRELPRLTGVSKEANAMALGFLIRRECVVSEPDPVTGRGKRVRLTLKGRRSQQKYLRLLAATEEEWDLKLGADLVRRLLGTLESMVGKETLVKGSPLWSGLQPFPNGWRAKAPRLETLPHYPMVLHRGGYPDGS